MMVTQERKIFNDPVTGIHRFSRPAFYVCKRSGLTRLDDIISFYNTYGSFTELKNCTEEIDKELCEICTNYMRLIWRMVEKTKETEEIEKFISELDIDEIIAVNKHIVYLVDKLAPRAKNLFQRIFDGIPVIYELSKKFMLPHLPFTA